MPPPMMQGYLPPGATRFPPVLKRQRASGPKVKTGCRTCKARRVKCDETKPECDRCKSTGRQCEGYEDPATRPKQKRRPRNKAKAAAAAAAALAAAGGGPSSSSDELYTDAAHENNSYARRTTSQSLVLHQHTPLSRVQLSPIVDSLSSQTRSYDFFRHFSLRDLSAIHEHRLWNRTVMPASLAEPAIYHAVVALGMMHEKLLSPGPATSNIHILQQYNKAVVCLTERLSLIGDYEVNKVALITCLIFTMLESLLKNPIAARKQLEYGITILTSWKPNRAAANVLATPARHVAVGEPDAVGSTEDDELVEKFARLDLVTARFLGQPQRFDRDELLPRFFNDLGEAYHYLGFQNSAVNSFTLNPAFQRAHPAATPDVYATREQRRAVLAERYARWEVLFDRLVSIVAVPAATLHDARIILNLRILHALNALTVACIHRGEMVYDEQMGTFRRALALCAELHATYGAAGMPTLSLDAGYTGLLVFTAMKCRDPALRRAAVAAMRGARPHNSFIHSTVAARFCAKVIELEERGLEGIVDAAQVPNEARFIFIYQKEAPDLKSAVVYGTRLGPGYKLVQESHVISLLDT